MFSIDNFSNMLKKKIYSVDDAEKLTINEVIELYKKFIKLKRTKEEREFFIFY